VLLRTVGLMESNLRERLADVAVGENSRILLDSFAGQTNIRLWVEGDSEDRGGGRIRAAARHWSASGWGIISMVKKMTGWSAWLCGCCSKAR
jgi:hypothetical protein